jgi:hypothetical protein
MVITTTNGQTTGRKIMGGFKVSCLSVPSSSVVYVKSFFSLSFLLVTTLSIATGLGFVEKVVRTDPSTEQVEMRHVRVQELTQ